MSRAPPVIIRSQDGPHSPRGHQGDGLGQLRDLRGQEGHRGRGLQEDLRRGPGSRDSPQQVKTIIVSLPCQYFRVFADTDTTNTTSTLPASSPHLLDTLSRA